MTTKHTPKPPSRCSKCEWIHEADTVRGTSFQGVGLCPLHAAAPEMLEALKRLHAVTKHFGLGNDAWTADIKCVEDAIAKAEGRQ